jgi:TyrR family helix-turn-helix protein
MSKNKIPKAKLEKAYRKYGTARATAEALGRSHTTINTLLKEYGIPKTPPERILQIRSDKCRFNDTKAHGAIAKYFRDHKDGSLPRDYTKIAHAVGTSYNAVKQYFYRQRRAVREMLGQIGDLREKNISLKTDKGKILYSKDIKDYYYTVDKFTIKASIVITDQGGSKHVAPIPDLRQFLLTARNSPLLTARSTERSESRSSQENHENTHPSRSA